MSSSQHYRQGNRRRAAVVWRWNALLFLFCYCLLLEEGINAFRQLPSITSRRLTASQHSLLFLARTEGSSVELTDPVTGCQVVLVGCFHGSPSSAKDVEREILQAASTDIIALELCASRFADLRRMMALRENATTTTEQQPPRLVRFLQVVRDTTRRKGISTGVATGILGGVSGLQTALSGFTPGLEFITAVDLAQQSQNDDCDIMLVDQSVDETVENVGNLPRVIHSFAKEIITSNPQPLEETQWGKMAAALRTALAGDPNLRDNQLNVGQVMTRNMDVIFEMARLLVPPILITQVVLALFNEILFPGSLIDKLEALPSLENLWTKSLENFDPLSSLADALPHVLILSLLLTTAYSVLAVPVTQVILAERDDQLTEGIQAACRVASAKSDSDSDGRVVAVLGLLHVNGVAQRLLSSDDEEIVVNISEKASSQMVEAGTNTAPVEI